MSRVGKLARLSRHGAAGEDGRGVVRTRLARRGMARNGKAGVVSQAFVRRGGVW